MQGRWKRYVEIRKRIMKAGDADVGMNRSGSQLRRQNMASGEGSRPVLIDGGCDDVCRYGWGKGV